MYACNPSEKAIVGVRQQVWEVEAPTQEHAVCEMARCLREINEGRVPK